MDGTDHRLISSQLSTDLTWLEDHCRRQPQLARETSQLRLAAALVRNVIGPFLNGQGKSPLHIAVVGGAGTGKSTIVNLLIGSVQAEANPQAGYTRHPTAYILGSSLTTWADHLGFLGPLQRLTEPKPANLDEDVYQVKRVETKGNPLDDVVIWDCPDMTTWAAGGYVSRLIEVSGLADVIVYVASDERYNDEVPTQFLHMLVRSGKPVVVVLTKMAESQAPVLVEHFEREVLGRLPTGPNGRPVVPVLAVPNLGADELSQPQSNASKYRIPLLNQVLVLADPEQARKRSVETSLRYLTASGGDLLNAARQDVAALEEWKSLVQSSRLDFEGRYRNEFLNGEGFRRFDEAKERLLDSLELPGAGRGFAIAMWGLRFPYRMARNLVTKSLVRPVGISVGEQQVLEGAYRAWMDLLRAEAIRRGETHPLWKHVSIGFSGGLKEATSDRFQADLRSFQLGSADEIEAAAREVTANLERTPATLAILRGGNLALDVTAIGLAIWAGGFAWPTLIYIPLFDSAAHQIVELGVRQYVEGKRDTVRTRKMDLVSQTISKPLADWLTVWPATGGSAYEKLQGALRRIPEAIQQLNQLTESRLRP